MPSRKVFCFFFFFQAEDGIRDYKVTGVQTCALPICLIFLLPSIKGKIRPCGYKSLRGKNRQRPLRSTPEKAPWYSSREDCKSKNIRTNSTLSGHQLRSTLLTCKSLRKSQRKEMDYQTKFYQRKVLCPLDSHSRKQSTPHTCGSIRIAILSPAVLPYQGVTL